MLNMTSTILPATVNLALLDATIRRAWMTLMFSLQLLVLVAAAAALLEGITLCQAP